MPFTAVLGRDFFPLLGKFFDTGTSVAHCSNRARVAATASRSPRHGRERLSDNTVLSDLRHQFIQRSNCFQRAHRQYDAAGRSFRVARVHTDKLPALALALYADRGDCHTSPQLDDN